MLDEEEDKKDEQKLPLPSENLAAVQAKSP